jgi:hypothetical protein
VIATGMPAAPVAGTQATVRAIGGRPVTGWDRARQALVAMAAEHGLALQGRRDGPPGPGRAGGRGHRAASRAPAARPFGQRRRGPPASCCGPVCSPRHRSQCGSSALATPAPPTSPPGPIPPRAHRASAATATPGSPGTGGRDSAATRADTGASGTRGAGVHAAAVTACRRALAVAVPATPTAWWTRSGPPRAGALPDGAEPRAETPRGGALLGGRTGPDERSAGA